MLVRVTSRELTEWMAAYRLEPWGERRADLQAAIVAQAVVNMLRDPRKGKPATVGQFMPRFGRPQKGGSRPQSPAAQQALVSAIMQSLGGEGG